LAKPSRFLKKPAIDKLYIGEAFLGFTDRHDINRTIENSLVTMRVFFFKKKKKEKKKDYRSLWENKKPLYGCFVI
jgi:hypothetical protein